MANPPDYGENGWVVVWWRDDGGAGYHGEWLNENRIGAGAVFFWTYDKKRNVYLEELTQVLGPRTGTETIYFGIMMDII